MSAAAAAPKGAQHVLTGAGEPVGPQRQGAQLELLALDAEFTHIQLARGGGRRSFATWLCLVDRFGGVALKMHCVPPALRAALQAGEEAPPVEGGCELPAGARFVGGVPLRVLQGAPSLEEARAAMLGVLRSGGCRVLVGHGLTKDLRALGVDAEADLRDGLGVEVYDTMACGKFQGRGGAARPLAALAQEFLGRTIQAGAHDPEEDAWAAAELYVRHVDYTYMVEFETARILARLPPPPSE